VHCLTAAALSAGPGLAATAKAGTAKAATATRYTSFLIERLLSSSHPRRRCRLSIPALCRGITRSRDGPIAPTMRPRPATELHLVLLRQAGATADYKLSIRLARPNARQGWPTPSPQRTERSFSTRPNRRP